MVQCLSFVLVTAEKVKVSPEKYIYRILCRKSMDGVTDEDFSDLSSVVYCRRVLVEDETFFLSFLM